MDQPSHSDSIDRVLATLELLASRGEELSEDEQDEEVEALIEVGERSGILEADEGRMVRGIVELDETPTLIRNDSEARGAWIGFTLVAKGQNRDAIGAWITVTDSNGIERVRARTSGASYLSSCDPRLSVGLGSASGPVRAVVHWPSGATSTHDALEPGRYVTLSEP